MNDLDRAEKLEDLSSDIREAARDLKEGNHMRAVERLEKTVRDIQDAIDEVRGF